ncbi:MAG: methyltetrahydrofolate cobalamin methyltransferase [Treponema sp.]|jgi:5-methyltetrahydrofolate--homocysteine methyltransferase|nr:methyltetrahydrofolate cobalamin methyltransferase [Treponema sp.]
MIIIGEKINGSIPLVGKAIAEKNADIIRDLAKRETDTGATFIDVCASVPEAHEVETLKWLVDLVQSVTDTPIALDSPSVKTLAAAIPFCNKPGLINSVSGEGGKMEVIFPIIAETGWQCVALLCDDSGLPKTAEKRLEVFGNIMTRAKTFGIAPARLHIDPLVEMLCTSEDGIGMVTGVMKEIKGQYPDIHITGGASNISFNLPARKFVNRAFIILSMAAGMDSAIIDPTNPDMIGLIYATEALLGYDEMCIEFITAFRAGLFEKK